MPRRNRRDNTRPVYDSYTDWSTLRDDLKRTWRLWQQAEAERAAARDQERRIDQFRRTYGGRS